VDGFAEITVWSVVPARSRLVVSPTIFFSGEDGACSVRARPYKARFAIQKTARYHKRLSSIHGAKIPPFRLATWSTLAISRAPWTGSANRPFTGFSCR
jgi:hypothetical protein